MAFRAPDGITLLVGETFFVDVDAEVAGPGGCVLADWWHLEDRYDPLGVPRGCRGGDPAAAVASSFSFSTGRGSATTVTCKDYWQGAQPGSTFWQPGVPAPGRIRLVGIFARPVSNAGPFVPSLEYFVGTGSFDTNHAVEDLSTIPPTSQCVGCMYEACLLFNYLLLQQPTGTLGGDVMITAQNVRQCLTWQSSRCASCFPDPVRRATWGQIKSLYR
jgi:hypothetical protein